jgi:hypothetical protein
MAWQGKLPKGQFALSRHSPNASINGGCLLKTLAAICLNEEQFIGAWLRYHYDAFDRIILCEGAARNYPRFAVTDDGVSSDRTASIIREFPDPERKISFIQYGWAGPEVSIDPRVPAKIELRNVYAALIEEGYVYTLDIDEFLHPHYVQALSETMDESQHADAYFIPQLHLWQDTRHFITGGYADVAHSRLYRWKPGTRYIVTHNWPSGPNGELLTNRRIQPKLFHEHGRIIVPAIVHYGFCEAKISTQEKNRYYLIRGERRTRPETMRFRNAALRGAIPPGCYVHDYCGFVPFLPSQ